MLEKGEGKLMNGETTGEVPEIPEVPKISRKIIIAILLIVIIGVASVSVLWWYTQRDGLGKDFPPVYNTYSKYGIEFEYPEGYEIAEETISENITWSQEGTAGGRPVIWNHSRIVNTVALKNDDEDLIVVVWTDWEKPEQPFDYWYWKTWSMIEVTIKFGRVMLGKFDYGDWYPATAVRDQGEIMVNGHDEYDASATWSDEPEMRSAKMEYASAEVAGFYGTSGQFCCFDTERVFSIGTKSYTEDADREAFFVVIENFKCH